MAPHNGEEFAYVLDGTVQLYCDDEKYNRPPGRDLLSPGEELSLHRKREQDFSKGAVDIHSPAVLTPRHLPRRFSSRLS
jgi:hypothetical protein